MVNNYLKTLFASVLIGLPATVFAEVGSYVLLQKIGSLDRVAPNTFATYMQEVIFLTVSISATIAVIMIVWGGFEYMLGESVGSKQSGLDRIKGAIYGLLLLLASYLILYTINPALLNLNLNPPATDTSGRWAPTISITERAATLEREARGEWTTRNIQDTISDATRTIEGPAGINEVLSNPALQISDDTRARLEQTRNEILALQTSVVQSSTEISNAAQIIAASEQNIAYPTTPPEEIIQHQNAMAQAFQDMSSATNVLATDGSVLKNKIEATNLATSCMYERLLRPGVSRNCPF